MTLHTYWNIRTGSKLLGVAHGVHKQFYLVGLPNEDIARRVALHADPSIEPLLKRSMAENVSLDVKRFMMKMDLPISSVADTISIDVMAHLTVYKKRRGDIDSPPSQLVYPVSTIEKQRMDDFLMLPFDSGIGVIMPHELTWESPNEYQFMCHVIDPCDIRDALKRMFYNI